MYYYIVEGEMTHWTPRIPTHIQHWWRSCEQEGTTSTLTTFVVSQPDLREQGFGACWTIRRGLPAEMKQNLTKGDVCSVAFDECKWEDKRQVPMLSTVHDDSMLTKVRRTRRVDGGRE